MTKATYGFNSKRSPPHVKELDEFEDCMLEMTGVPDGAARQKNPLDRLELSWLGKLNIRSGMFRKHPACWEIVSGWGKMACLFFFLAIRL